MYCKDGALRRTDKSRRPVRCARLTISLLVGATILTACAQGNIQPAALQAPSGSVSEDKDGVACLLPGQVRKLGSGMTYLAPRRLVETSRGDCEIRGGDFTS